MNWFCKLLNKMHKKRFHYESETFFLWALTDSNRRLFRLYRNALNQLS